MAALSRAAIGFRVDSVAEQAFVQAVRFAPKSLQPWPQSGPSELSLRLVSWP